MVRQSTQNTGYYLKSTVTIVIMFGFGYLPPIEPLSRLGMQILGIFIALLFAWTFVDLIWPSMLALVALGLTEYDTMKGVFKAGFGDDLFILVLLTFILSAYLNKVGLTKFVANWFISRKIAVGRPWVFSTMVFLAAYIMGTSISLVATVIIMWNIFYEMCDTIGYKKGDKYPIVMLIGIAFAAMLGFTIFPFKAVNILMINALENTLGVSVDFFKFSITTFVISVVALGAFVLACKYIFKPDTTLLSGKVDFFADLRQERITNDQKVAGLAMIVFLFMILAPSILPNWPIIKLFKTFGMTASLAVVLCALIIARKKDGAGVLDFMQLANSETNWQILIMFAGTMPVSAAMSSDKSGVMDFIVYHLNPLFVGMSPLMFTILFALFTLILTQFMHNLVLSAVITPVMCRFAVELGADPIAMTTVLAFSLNCALATPGASASSALIFGNRAWLPIKDAYIYCTLTVLIMFIVMITVGVPLTKLFF